MRARLVIIGSGTTGLCLALEVARRSDPLSEPIVLLSGPRPTRAGLELCRHDLEGRGLALEARHGLRFWSGLWSQTGRDPGWNACGAVIERDTREEPMGWDRLRELGLPVQLESGRFIDHEAGTLDIERARKSLEMLAREAGAVVRMGEEARELRVEGGRVLGVQTSSGEIDSPLVVLAGVGGVSLTPGGAPALLEKTWRERLHGGGHPQRSRAVEQWTAPSLSDLQEPQELNPLAMASAYQDHFEAQEPEGTPERAHIRGALTAAPDLSGGLWVGGFDYSPKEVDQLATYVLGEFTSGEVRERSLWEGGDTAPIVGQVPSCEGVWIACGFGSNASLFAPACAEGLASRILDGTSGWFAGPEFDPSRETLSWPSRSR